MHQVPLMNEIALIAAVSVVVTVALGKLKLPASLVCFVRGCDRALWTRLGEGHARDRIDCGSGCRFTIHYRPRILAQPDQDHLSSRRPRRHPPGRADHGRSGGDRALERPWPESWVIGCCIVQHRGCSEDFPSAGSSMRHTDNSL